MIHPKLFTLIKKFHLEAVLDVLPGATRENQCIGTAETNGRAVVSVTRTLKTQLAR